MGTDDARIRLRPSSVAATVAILLAESGTAMAGWAARGEGFTSSQTHAQWGAAAVVLVAAVLVARRVRGRIDVGAEGLVVRHAGLVRPLRIPRDQVVDAVAGDARDVQANPTLPHSWSPDAATLVLHLAAPRRFSALVLQRTVQARVETDRLALVAADPDAAARVLRTAGIPAAPPLSAFRPPRRSRWTRALPGRALVVPAALLGALLPAGAFGGEPAHPTGVSPPRFAPVPDVPEASARYRASLPDGTQVWAWRTSARTVRVRIDTLAARCSGADWLEDDHTVDLRGLRLDRDGAFARRARVEELYDAGGLDVVTVVLRGRVAGDRVTGTVARVDDNHGIYTGVCRTTVRFSAPRD